MIYHRNIEGKYVVLRSVNIDDAEFIIKLRTNEKYNKFLHTTGNNISLQRSWIKQQQDREGDYYFVIQNQKGHVLGLISIYNINGKMAECGRWISEGNAFENLEAAKLIHEFGFRILGLELIYTCTVKENLTVVNFWIRFGGVFAGYVFSEPFTLYKNNIDIDLYSGEIEKKINKLLYKQ